MDSGKRGRSWTKSCGVRGVLGRVERGSCEHYLGGNTQCWVLGLNTTNNTQISRKTQVAQHKIEMEPERIFY